MFIILFLVAILCGVSGYLIGVGTGNKNMKNQKTSEYMPIISPTPPPIRLALLTTTATPTRTIIIRPTPIPASFTTWRAYTSPSGYSVKYPKEINYNEANGYPYDIQLTNSDLSMTFVVEGLAPDKTANSYDDSFCPLGTGASSRSQVQINGIPVYRTPNPVNTSTNSQCQEAVIDLQKANWIVDIQALINTPAGNILFNQIISTFKLSYH
jgi:hypothetical protein